jgi:hypothetical protein
MIAPASFTTLAIEEKNQKRRADFLKSCPEAGGFDRTRECLLSIVNKLQGKASCFRFLLNDIEKTKYNTTIFFSFSFQNRRVKLMTLL